MADVYQLSASVDQDFTNSTPGSATASCGLGSFAEDFGKGLVKGALVTGVVLVGIALLPEEAAAAALTGLAWLGAYGIAKLGWNVGTLLGKQANLIVNQDNMTPQQIAQAKTEILQETHKVVEEGGEFAGGGLVEGGVSLAEGLGGQGAGAPETGQVGSNAARTGGSGPTDTPAGLNGGATDTGGPLNDAAGQDAPATGAPPGPGGALKGGATAEGYPPAGAPQIPGNASKPSDGLPEGAAPGGGSGPLLPAVFDGEFATQQLLGTTTTPGGRQIMFHAADRMVNPPAGRVAMSPAEIDQVLDGATKIDKMSVHPEGDTLTIRNANMPGSPRVIVDAATGKRVITVINPRIKR